MTGHSEPGYDLGSQDMEAVTPLPRLGFPRPTCQGKVYLPSFSAGLTRSCYILSSQVVGIVTLLHGWPLQG